MKEELLNLQNEVTDVIGCIEHGVIQQNISLYILDCIRTKLRLEANKLEKVINLYEVSPCPEGNDVENDALRWKEKYLEIVRRIHVLDRISNTKKLDSSLASQH